MHRQTHNTQTYHQLNNSQAFPTCNKKLINRVNLEVRRINKTHNTRTHTKQTEVTMHLIIKEGDHKPMQPSAITLGAVIKRSNTKYALNINRRNTSS